jgi:prephenate dehydrogenase
MTRPLYMETPESHADRVEKLQRILTSLDGVRPVTTDADVHNERMASQHLASLFAMETVE